MKMKEEVDGRGGAGHKVGRDENSRAREASWEHWGQDTQQGSCILNRDLWGWSFWLGAILCAVG